MSAAAAAAAAAAGVVVGWEGRERLLLIVFSVRPEPRALVFMPLVGCMKGGAGEACCVLEGEAAAGGGGEAPPRTKRA